MQFSSNKIDSIKDIPDIDSIKLKDLNIHYHGGCSAYKGQGAGRRLTYRTSAVCNLGDILDSVWTELAIKTVERILGAEYLEKVQDFVREYGIPTEKRSDKTIMNAALDICTSERWNRSSKKIITSTRLISRVFFFANYPYKGCTKHQLVI